jgi:two-component system copper resistance phosphate regulon response regulator CusR
MRIFLAEDEQDLNAIIVQKLTEDGYSVDHCFDGRTAIDILSCTEYDAVILDIMMPKADGFTVLRALRGMGKTTPVLFLTAKDAVSDRVKGLDSGANDYLVKPFSFQELEARIKALLRRSGNESVHMALRCGDLVLDPPSHRAIRNGQVIDLTVKEYRLLEYFIQNQGTALSRMNLLKNVWDKDFDTNTNVVDVYVNYLRTKIDKDFEPKLIRTVVGVGYMMEA